MTPAGRGTGRAAEPGGAAPADAWAQRQLQAERMIDGMLGAAARAAARAREELEDVWAEAEQLRRDGSASG
jgi:hypothetical protein